MGWLDACCHELGENGTLQPMYGITGEHELTNFTGAREPRILDEARLKLEKLLSYSNHVALYAEEISPTGEALGNFPQAFTHLALITACVHLDHALDAHPSGSHPTVENPHGRSGRTETE